MLFAGSPAPSANSIIYNSKTTKPQPRFAAGVFACFSCEINQNQRTPSHTLPKKAGNRFGNRTLGQTRRWRALHQAHGRANMLHRPPLSPSRAFCAPAQWRQAQHKRCHRLCTISRSARNIRSRKGFQRVVYVGDALQQLRIPFFGRAVIVKPSVNHQLVLPWIGGKFPRAHGIAVRQTIEQRIGQIIQNVPNENARCNLAFPLSKEIGKCFDTAR